MAELTYVGLIFTLFVLPRALGRVRVPGAITCLGLGLGASIAGLFRGDATLGLLATFGIVALFLFAGLEIEEADLRRGARVLLEHLAARFALVALFALAAARVLGLGWRPAWLLALALLTPSCGFILSSLDSYGLSPSDRFWTKTKAIATELLALGTMFVALQSTSPLRLAGGVTVLAALVVLLPVLFRLFADRVAPFAPRSEFAFLIMLAVVFAVATRRLGVYYLVGAFLVGVGANRFRDRLPALSSERILHALEAFASVFVPFYFFSAGLHIRPGDLGWRAFAAGAVFLAVALPARVLQLTLHHKLSTKGTLRSGLPVAIALMPTLVFTLVLGEILRDRFAAPGWLFGGLVVYAVVNTVLPGLFLKGAVPEYEAPQLEEPPQLDKTPGSGD